MEKKVKKIFANRYAVFQSMTNSSHLVWLLKRITLIANRKLSKVKRYGNNKDEDEGMDSNVGSTPEQ